MEKDKPFKSKINNLFYLKEPNGQSSMPEFKKVKLKKTHARVKTDGLLDMR